MTTQNKWTCLIEAPEEQWTLFFELLQEGVAAQGKVDISLREFLLRELDLEASILERAQTVFLNSRPVDDFDEATVRDGATIALSAAMPGLVGAVMRRDGAYAKLREGISYHADAATGRVFSAGRDASTGSGLACASKVGSEDDSGIGSGAEVSCGPGTGRIRVKVFNMLLSDLGPALLRRGVWTPARRLGRLLAALPADFWEACRRIHVNGNEINPRVYEVGFPKSEREVLLTLVAPKTAPDRAREEPA